MIKKYSEEYYEILVKNKLREEFINDYVKPDDEYGNVFARDVCDYAYGGELDHANDSFDDLLEAWLNALACDRNSEFDDYRTWYLESFESDEERVERENTLADVMSVDYGMSICFTANVRLTETEKEDFHKYGDMPSISTLDSLENEITDLLRKHGFYNTYARMELSDHSYDFYDESGKVYVSDETKEKENERHDA